MFILAIFLLISKSSVMFEKARMISWLFFLCCTLLGLLLSRAFDGFVYTIFIDCGIGHYLISRVYFNEG